MAFTRAWRNFKRMQDLTVVVASLIYAGAVVHAADRLAAGATTLAVGTLAWPAFYLVASLIVPMLVAPVKRWLARYVWMSFQAGFGQTPGSVLTGVALLIGAAAFIYWQVGAAAANPHHQANVFAAFSAYAAGILAAQAILVRALERLPEVRARIEEKG